MTNLDVLSGGGRLRRAPAGAVALVALGAALWGLDGVLRQPLVVAGEGAATWSAWTIVFYEHIILTAVVLQLEETRMSRHSLAAEIIDVSENSPRETSWGARIVTAGASVWKPDIRSNRCVGSAACGPGGAGGGGGGSATALLGGRGSEADDDVAGREGLTES